MFTFSASLEVVESREAEEEVVEVDLAARVTRERR